jgi:hypothetical protein
MGAGIDKSFSQGGYWTLCVFVSLGQSLNLLLLGFFLYDAPHGRHGRGNQRTRVYAARRIGSISIMTRPAPTTVHEQANITKYDSYHTSLKFHTS